MTGTPMRISNPGELVASVPGILGFTPVDSVVVVTTDSDGAMLAALRQDIDIVAEDAGDIGATAAHTGAARAYVIIVDAQAFDDDYRTARNVALAGDLGNELALHNVGVVDSVIVDRIAVGGRISCACGCGAQGPVPDPASTAMMATSVFDGRRIWNSREEMAAQLAPVARPIDPAQIVAAVADRLHHNALSTDIGFVLDLLRQRPSLTDKAMLAAMLTDFTTRDVLLGMTLTEHAAQLESLLTETARWVPPPWRADALTAVAFYAYMRGDGSMAGMAVDTALRIDSTHALAQRIYESLRRGVTPDQIKPIAATAYAIAARFGVELPARVR